MLAYLNLGTILRSGKLREAEFSTRKAIKINLACEAHSNLGSILKNLGKLKERIFDPKAIEIKPDYALVHSNLGSILKNLGKLKEAKFCFAAIKIQPYLANAYFLCRLLNIQKKIMYG